MTSFDQVKVKTSWAGHSKPRCAPLRDAATGKYNTWMGTLKPQSNGPLYNNKAIGTRNWPLMGGLLHLVQRGGPWAGCGHAQLPPRSTKCNSPPINGQYTNFISFDVALWVPVPIKGLIAWANNDILGLRLILVFSFSYSFCMKWYVFMKHTVQCSAVFTIQLHSRISCLICLLFTSVAAHYIQLQKASVSQWSSIHFHPCPHLKRLVPTIHLAT